MLVIWVSFVALVGASATLLVTLTYMALHLSFYFGLPAFAFLFGTSALWDPLQMSESANDQLLISVQLSLARIVSLASFLTRIVRQVIGVLCIMYSFGAAAVVRSGCPMTKGSYCMGVAAVLAAFLAKNYTSLSASETQFLAAAEVGTVLLGGMNLMTPTVAKKFKVGGKPNYTGF